MIPAIQAGSDALDVGRHPATIAEIEARFVTHPDFAGSTTRADIWQEWLVATSYLRAQVPVIAAWIGGSFTTTKLNPGDIDCTYLIDHQEAALATSDPARAGVLAQFSVPNTIRSALGWRVDHYVCVWRDVPNPGVVPRTAPEWEYYRIRGHWDDWWQRRRMSAAGAVFTRDDTLPRRGYLEVMLDGY